MANATTVETSYTEENSKDDDFCENIPPGIPSTSQLKVHIGNIEGCASMQQEADFESRISSTPAPANNNVKSKSRLSGIQCALTPILKYLSIGNKGSSPETVAEGNNPTARALSHRSNAELTSSCSRQAPGDTEVCWLADECLPDITLLDVTCDTTMQLAKNDSALPESLPSTPARAHPAHSSITPKPSAKIQHITQILPTAVGCHTRESDANRNAIVSKNSCLVLKQSSSKAEKESLCTMQQANCDKQESSITSSLSANPPKTEITLTMSNTSSHDSHHSSWEKLSFSEVCSGDDSHAQTNEMSNYDTNAPREEPNAEMSEFPERIDAPLCFLDSRIFPEITLLDITGDTGFSPQSKKLSIKVDQNTPSVERLQNRRVSLEKSVDVTRELGTSNLVQNKDIGSPVDVSVTNKSNSCSEQSGKCVGENIPKVSLETTRDISMGSFLENNQRTLESSSQGLEKTQTPVTDPVCEKAANLTRDISSSSVASAPSDAQCNVSTKNATFELYESTASTNAASEDCPQSCEGELSGKEVNPKAPDSASGTFMIAEQLPDVSVDKATTMSCPQNGTLVLPSSPTVQSSPKNEPMPPHDDSRGTHHAVSHSCPSVEPGVPSAVQNVTFERLSLQGSTSNISGEATAATSDLQNNTFDVNSSKKNATITMCERSSSYHSVEKLSPPKDCPATGSPKGENSDVLLVTKHNETKVSATSELKAVCTTEGKCKSDPTEDTASEPAQRETVNRSESGPPVKDGGSDPPVHQSMDIEENQGATFCLDDTLDLRGDPLITSTPMVDTRMSNFNIEQDQGKIMSVQKKLYKDPPGMPSAQLSSNIVCDRKTFLTQPTGKLLLPPLKAASQLPMKKAHSAIPGRPESMASGLPVTRLRSKAETLRASASDAVQVPVGFMNRKLN